MICNPDLARKLLVVDVASVLHTSMSRQRREEAARTCQLCYDGSLILDGSSLHQLLGQEGDAVSNFLEAVRLQHRGSQPAAASSSYPMSILSFYTEPQVLLDCA